MSDIALDSGGDIAIADDGSMFLVIDIDAIVQHLQIRFKFVLGEWFLDTRVGIPYFEELLVKNPDLSRVRGIFQQVILETPGIDSIAEFTLGLDGVTRKLSLDFLARTTDGQTLSFQDEFIIR